jgi:hypothetical protein
MATISTTGYSFVRPSLFEERICRSRPELAADGIAVMMLARLGRVGGDFPFMQSE